MAQRPAGWGRLRTLGRVKPRVLSGLTVLCLGAAFAGCGGGESGADREPEPVGRQTASKRADQLCRQYRARVTEVHYKGSNAQVGKELRALADGAREAFEQTRIEELGEGGREYLETLDALVPIYAQAAAAKRSGDSGGYKRALEQTGPLDRRLDGLTERVGLRQCALGKPRGDEARASRPGFPSMVVPRGSEDAEPAANDASIAYPLSGKEALLVSRGPKTRLGRTSLAYAAYFFRRSTPAAAKAKPRGKVGREPVPMRRFEYREKRLRGMTYVFSGQGNLWVLLCATRGKDPSAALMRACTRAASTTGFLMF